MDVQQNATLPHSTSKDSCGRVFQETEFDMKRLCFDLCLQFKHTCRHAYIEMQHKAG